MSLHGMARVSIALAIAVAATAMSGPASAADYWTVLALVSDEKGQEVPIRYGDATLGFTKACQLHNFCNVAYMQATLAGRKLIMVFLDSAGKYSRIGDAERVRKWLVEHSVPALGVVPARAGAVSSTRGILAAAKPETSL